MLATLGGRFRGRSRPGEPKCYNGSAQQVAREGGGRGGEKSLTKLDQCTSSKDHHIVLAIFLAATCMTEFFLDAHCLVQIQGARLSAESKIVDESLPPVSMAWTGKFKQLIKKSHQSEVPDFPLDQQPDPERVTHIDADLRSCLGPARDTMGCGACYAFSWNSLLEWHYCKQTGELLNLSEQHIVDCSNFGGFDGCRAGKIEDVRRFAEQFGFYLEQEYPYTAKFKPQSFDKCNNIKQQGRRFRAADWTRLVVDPREWEQVLVEQPILVQARLPADIERYKGGIHPGDNCSERLLHGMLLVGHGREAGQPYWLVRNSMGAKWGESGHFRLARNDSTMAQCFATGWVGKFKFDSVGADKYEEFYSQIEFEPTEHVLKQRSRSSS